MNKNLRDLIDLEKVSRLLEGFNKSTGFVTAILDLEGNVLSKSGWRQICTEFHRVHPKTSERCTYSDTVLAGKMEKEGKYHAYTCLNGLTDVAVPIVINGQHVGNLFSGQFLLEEPDIDFFKKQANKFGFDEKEYIKALYEVPVISEEKVKTVMDFLIQMTNLISELGVEKTEQVELNKRLRGSKNELKAANQQLDAHNQQLQASEQTLKKQAHKLNERVKELNCLHRISESVRTRETMEEILQDVTEVIPPSWQYPQITGSNITLWDKEYKTENYKDSQWKLSSDIRVNKKIVGKIEVCYLGKKPESDIGPFLNEERILLDDITERLGHIIERKNAEESLKATNQQLRAANQQLRATEQQLRAANQQLEASNKELIGKEQLLSSIFNTVGDVLFLIDVEAGSKFRFKYTNKAFLDTTGLSRSDIEGKLIEEVIPEPSIHIVKENYLKSIKEKKLITWEETSEYPAGVKTGIASIVPVIDEKGNCRQLVGSVHDITKRKQAEDKLKESEEKYRVLFEKEENAIFIYESETFIIVDANPAMTKTYGYSYDELIGMNCLKFSAEIEKSKNAAVEADKKGMVDVKLRWHKKKDGTVFPLELQVYQTELEGRTVGFAVAKDITERKQAEKVLKESEEKFRKAFSTSPDSININRLDDGLYISINDGFTKITGYSESDVIGKTSLEINIWANPKDREKLVEGLRKHDQVQNLEAPFRMKDGKVVYGLMSATVITLDGVQHIISITRDITERKQAEKELIKLSTAVKQSSSVIAITDTDGNIEYVNPKFTEVNGYSQEEVIGQNFRILKSGEYPAEFYKELWETISSGKTLRGEIQNKKKNGELYWESASISPVFDEKGNIINYIKVAEDITGQKRNEQIQSIIHHISNAVITGHSLKDFLQLVKEELGKLIDATNFFVALYDEKTDRISLPLHQDEKDRGESFPAGKTLTHYVIKTGKPLLAKKAMVEKLIKSGEVERVGYPSEVWLGVPLKSKNKITGIFAVQSYDNENAYDEADVKMLEIISHQISLSLERLKAEEDLKLAKEKAEESDRLKSAFLANMSHEIRTPMNAILGFTELLKEPQLTGDEKDEYIRIIEKSGDRLLNTINDIVDISRIEAGEVKVTKTEVSVNEILEEQYNFFYNEAKSKGLELIYKPSLSDREARIIIDKHKLEGILTNLIKNAIKFTETGSITFGYDINTLEDKEYFEFYVNDTGIGIPADRVDAVFNRFVQADIGDTRVFEGSGLGLAIAKSYVEMFGGKISVKSKEGEGSTFTFTIPYNRQNLKESGATQNKEEESGISLKNLSIIVAEDDETTRLLYEKIFKNKLKKITYTTTGKETIEKCRENPDTDIILMDIKMPDMNGYDATREIRKFNNDIVIIAQTAFGLAGDRKKAIEAGSNDYIAKPIKKEILFEKIRMCLDKKSN